MTKGKILFDLNHDEDPTDLLIDRLLKEGFACEPCRKSVTVDFLNRYTAFVLNYPRGNLEDEEKDAIEEYSMQGGCVVLTSNLQTRKGYEDFIGNKGDLIKNLLGAELKYKQLFPYFPIDLPENVARWVISRNRNMDLVPKNAPRIRNEYGEAPTIYLNHLMLKIGKIDSEKRHPIIERVDEELIQPRGQVSISYFSPVEYPNMLLTQGVSLSTSFIHDSDLKNIGFCENMPTDILIGLNASFRETSEKFRSVCVGMMNTMQSGMGRNFGFSANLFSEEQIEDRNRKSNLKLITDVLKFGSETKLYLLSPDVKTPMEIALERKESRISELEQILQDSSKAQEILIKSIIRMGELPNVGMIEQHKPSIDARTQEIRKLMGGYTSSNEMALAMEGLAVELFGTYSDIEMGKRAMDAAVKIHKIPPEKTTKDKEFGEEEKEIINILNTVDSRKAIYAEKPRFSSR